MQTPLYVRIRREDGTRQYVLVEKQSNGKLKPHPKGTYHLRPTIGGKRPWIPVGNDSAAAIAAALRYEASKAGILLLTKPIPAVTLFALPVVQWVSPELPRIAVPEN